MIPIDNQYHDYTNLPQLEKMMSSTNKLREEKNEHTKQFRMEDTNKRTVADTGGNSLIRESN